VICDDAAGFFDGGSTRVYEKWLSFFFCSSLKHFVNTMRTNVALGGKLD